MRRADPAGIVGGNHSGEYSRLRRSRRRPHFRWSAHAFRPGRRYSPSRYSELNPMDRKIDELLFALMQNMTIAVSGEKLARDLGVSHSTLSRWIDKLREAGVEIRGELFTGYRLTRIPDVMLPQWIRPRLRTQSLGRNIFHFYSVDSTNAFASRLLNHGRKVVHGTTIIAELQTAGRGRLGRSWHSEQENGLYFSLVLRPRIPPGFAPLFTLGTAVALQAVVARQTGLQVDIKWPNDLL